MKKAFPLLFFIIGLSSYSSAQSHLAFKTGFNSSRLNADDDSPVEFSSRPAYNLALAYTFKSRNTPLGFSVEPGYTLKGAKVSIDTVDYKYDYLTLPILIDFYPLKRLRISAGPEISYLAGARNIGAKKQVVDTVQVINVTDNYDNRMEVSATLGVSYPLDFFLDLGFRYNRGLTRITDLDAITNRRKLYNEYLQVFLLFRIAN